MTPLSASSAAATSQQWRNVTYDGVRLSVPASWPVIRFARHPTACPRLDVHAVYLGTPAPDPICPAGLIGKTEAVMIGPGRQDGQVQPARTGHQAHARRAARATRAASRRTGARARSAVIRPVIASKKSAVSRTIADVIRGSGVRVGISYGTDQPLAETIQSTVKLAGRPRRRRLAGSELSAGTELLKHTEFARTTKPRTTKPRAASHSPAPAKPSAQQAIFMGSGFDSCAAPSANAMTKWLSSGFRAVGVYIGGANRACAQANLTSAWLTTISGHGWHYFAIYPGLQSSCVQASGDATIVTSQAGQEGKTAANDAVAQATSLGIPAGAPLIFDMEAYGPSCDSQVTTFLSAWDKQIEARGYTSGVYESFTNVGALVSAADSITEPQVIYYADWDGNATTNSSYMPASMWLSHERLHQYQGAHLATFGGVSIDIDSDKLDVNLSGPPAGPTPTTPARKSGLRIALGMNSNGTAEWFARSARGTLTHSWQAPVGSLTWSPMHTVGHAPRGVVSNPAVTSQADGSLAIFARTSAGTIVHGWQQAGFPNGWEWGKPLPPAASTTAAAMPGTDPAALLLPSGRVELFQTGRDGKVSAISLRQPNDGSHWSAWQNLGGSCASTPVPITDGGHDVDVFCVTTRKTAATTSWNGVSWSRWSTLAGSPSNLIGIPSVVLNGSGQAELFATISGGGLADARQSGKRRGWTWGEPLANAATGESITGSPSAATWPVGQVVVYAKLSTGQLESIRQNGTTGGSPWASWTPISGVPGGKAASSPVGWLDSVDAASVAVIDQDRGLSVSSNTGGGWSSWTEIGTGF